MQAKKKDVLFRLALLVFVVGLAELICFATFSTLKKRFTFFDLNSYCLTEEHIMYSHQRYHPERGWDNLYATEFGERPRTYMYYAPLVCVFGDSFVHCDGVKDSETWQEYLSALLKKDVFNFGTGGYGADQAYLKFLSVFPKVKTPIVILGLTTENIGRIVNVYRPFYFEKTGVRLTKPRFTVRQDRLFLLPNPVPSFGEIKNLRNANFLRKIGKNDYWFNRGRYPEFRFPYLRILLNKRVWGEIMYDLGGGRINDISPRPYQNFWEDAKITALMFKILESFVTTARDQGSTPILMLLPLQSEVIDKFNSREGSPGEKKILDFCHRNNVLVFNTIEELAKQANSVSEIDKFFDTHLSRQGNQIIAQRLYDFLNASLLNTNKD